VSVRAPDYRPQLATLVKEPPSGDEWLHEIKYDGYRIGARIRNGRVALYSRNGKTWTAAFPEIVGALETLDVADVLLDGEIAIVLPDGRTSFQALQNAFSETASRAALVYFVFDLLRHGRERMEGLPLEERKTRLKRLLGGGRKGRLRYSDHVEGDGHRFFDEGCRAGLEGIISKRRDQPYRPGRSGDWLKTKCVLRQEFAIGGFTDPEGARAGIGALLVGYYARSKQHDAAHQRLMFAGKVGTGFSQKSAIDLRRRLERIEQKTSPFTPAPPGPAARRAHWVKPSLVAEVVFTEWTGDGKIRHPSFQGLRQDKTARDVTREQPRLPRRQQRAPTPVVTLSSPDRLVYSDPPITKQQLADYYESIAAWVVPHVAGRPLTLVHCPRGIEAGCTFMRHSKVWGPSTLRRVRIQEKTKVGEYLVADDLSGVIGLVQMGVVEIHTWNSTVLDLERPNRLVIDLDPGDDVTWPQVIGAARTVRRALAALDLEAWVKTTGGRGLHVVVPLVPRANWTECLAFTRALAERLAAADPAAFTTAFARSGRSDKILIDYLRNNRTNTSIAAFSSRARTGAPVSVPVSWEDLRPALQPQAFTVLSVPPRLRRLRKDPWTSYWSVRQSLTAQRLRAVAGMRYAPD
jgi:bifunctional non-homologous end joining protein LigD